MFRIVGDDLWHDDIRLGSKETLYVDSKELAAAGPVDGVKRIVMPHRIDAVMCAEDKVVGIESKLHSDFVSSSNMGRLSRQVVVILTECDVACIALRGVALEDLDQDVLTKLVKFQALGIIILPCSVVDRTMVKQLSEYAEFLDGGRAALSAVAWTDLDLKTKSKKFPGWYLTGIKGLGKITAAKLHKFYGNTGRALAGSDEGWKSLKVSDKVIKRKKEAMK